MRKVVLYTLMSLDGDVDHPGQYFARPEKAGEGPPVFDPEMAEHSRTVIGAQDTVLLGRHMYDEWVWYWPTSDVQPFADFINGVEKVIVTSTPLATAWTNAEAVSGPIGDVIRDLKARPGGDIGVHGSIQLAQSLLAADLVDELHLVVGAIFGFPGRRLFDGAPGVRRLQLVSAASTSTGTLLLTYRRPPTA